MAIKLTDARKTAIITALENGNTRPAAASAGRLRWKAFLDAVAADGEFEQEIIEAEHKAERAHVANINRAAVQGKLWTASAWWLERRYPQYYGRVDRVEILVRQQQAEQIAEELKAEGIEVSPLDIMREYKIIERQQQKALPPPTGQAVAGINRKAQRAERAALGR